MEKFHFFQEAKSSCAGQWYLPAGRMEPGEDIAEAAQREVLEETGLHFQLSTLLMVEAAGKYLPIYLKIREMGKVCGQIIAVVSDVLLTLKLEARAAPCDR